MKRGWEADDERVQLGISFGQAPNVQKTRGAGRRHMHTPARKREREREISEFGFSNGENEHSKPSEKRYEMFALVCLGYLFTVFFSTLELRSVMGDEDGTQTPPEIVKKKRRTSTQG